MHSYKRLLRGMGLVLVGLLLIALVSQAQPLPFDPTLSWQTLETPHFWVSYHTGLAGPAREAAQIAEKAYKFWTAELAYAPPGRTNIVLADASDFANGYAQIMPNKTIMIYTSAWNAARWANSRFPGWLEQVITHEYGHIVDLTNVQGFSRYLRAIFGSIIAPNAFKPTVWREGIPDYGVFLKSGHSRADDPRTAMILRLLTKSGRWPTLAQLGTHYHRQEWPPSGVLAQDLGPWLLRYLSERYGRDSVARLDAAQAENLPALLSLGFLSDFGQALRSVTGVEPEKLYRGFQDWSEAQMKAFRQALQAAGGETPSRALTHLGHWSGAPAWSPDGKTLVYRHRDPARMAGLRLVDSSGKHDIALLSGRFAAPAWLPHQAHPTLIYPKLGIFKRYYLFYDLYSYDLVTRQEKRLTTGERAYAVAPFPDGRHLLIARDDDSYLPEQAGPGSSLIIYDLVSHSRQILLELGGQATIESLAISPDGQTIALSLWQRGGYQDIYLLTRDGRYLWSATRDRATDLDPSWSADGRYVLFSSDRSGGYDLYAYRVADARLFRVTRSFGGAFAPAVSPNGVSIAFMAYSASGYDLRLMPYDPQAWTPVEQHYEHIPPWPGYPQLSWPIRPYNPIPSLLPKLWLPWLDPAAGRLGLFTWGQDALDEQRFRLQLGYAWRRASPFFELSYLNSQLGATLALQAGGDLLSSHTSLALSWPLVVELTRRQTVKLGYRHSTSPGQSRQQLFGSWKYSAQQGLGLWRDSVNISLSGQWGWSRATGSGVQTAARRVLLDWQERVRLPGMPQQELLTHLVAGWSDLSGAFQLGGTDGPYALPGFPPGLLRGKQLLWGKLEYRFPLLAVERGLGLWPLFLDKLSGALFLTAGSAADRIDLSRLRVSWGGELRLGFILERSLPLSLRLGLAQGLGQPGPQLYLRWSGSF